MNKFLIIDGNSLLHRSYHGVRPLTNKDGVHTHAIFGFLNTYLSLKKQYKPTYIAVAFDTSMPTFRHAIFSEYKGNRSQMPDDLAEQFVYIKRILKYMGICCIESPGFEADDILGTISRICNENNVDCNIVSGDRDVLQLIGGNTKVTLLKTRDQKLYDEEVFFEEYGYKPLSLIDFKAIVGDSSDNYMGIKGIGERTVNPLLKAYGTVEGIYQHLGEVKLTPRMQGLFLDNKDDALLCKRLATISQHAPIDENLERYTYNGFYNEEKLFETLTYLEMRTIISKLKLTPEEEELELSKRIIPNITSIVLDEDFIPKSFSNDYLIKDGSLYIREGSEHIIYQLQDRELIKNYLENDVYKRTIGCKESFHYTSDVKNLSMDAELSGYLLDTASKEYTVQSLCKRYDVDYFEELGEYADIYSLPLLNDTLSTRVYDLEMDKLADLEIDVAKVLAEMETTGVKVDIPTVKSYQVMLDKILDGLESNIYLKLGHQFKILSSKQLGNVLFNELGLTAEKQTKTGYSTDNDVLEKLKDEHPIVPMIIEYRFYHKLKSTYLDGLLKSVSSDGKIHTVFRQTETRTGRLSSAEPNLQNIPIRNDFAKNIRKFFIAEDDHVLIDADYDQIELRITASLSQDKNMINNFLTGKDVHTTTAMKIFHRDTAEEITPQMRGVAKSINYGIIYGMGAKKFAQELGVPLKEAKQYIANYFEMYPNIKEYMETVIEGCKLTGYVKTVLNRIRYVPEITYVTRKLQANGERIAMNTPIQGSSADIIKLAMVNVYNRLKKENLDAKLILQVHDELLIESHKSCADRVAVIVKEEMENAFKLEVPLVVDVKIGGSWFDVH